MSSERVSSRLCSGAPADDSSVAIQLSSSHLKSFIDTPEVIVTPIDVTQDVVKVAKSIRLELELGPSKKAAGHEDDEEREEKWTGAVIRERLSESSVAVTAIALADTASAVGSGTEIPHPRSCR